MESSDDEAEAVPLSVSNYHFEDAKEPISFHTLPIQWSENDNLDRKEAPLFLHGSADNGLEKIYRTVTAWRFDLSNVNPEIAVLSKDKEWIVLQKPRRSYEGIVKSILVTVQCLSYAKRNADASRKAVWDHLSKVFSMYDDMPAESDLAEHTSLISQAFGRDVALGKSKFIADFLKEPTKKKQSDEDIQATSKPGFIVDDAEDFMIDDEDDSNDDDDNLFDSVCAFCDNGGELLCCEGRCLRSFHPTVEDGEESACESLGFTREEVNAMPSFFCKNCRYKQHQCFVCGKLGSSDKSSSAEVFPCVSATCGQFYHPHCVAQLIYQDNGLSVKELEKKISGGESFTCPIHKCYHCKQGENNKDPKLRFAVCRRCPKSYHRKCLPSEICLEKKEEDEAEVIEDEDEVETRAWEGLLRNRILIYCTEHEIDEEIGTPIRDHVKFPDVDGQKTAVAKKKTTFEEKKRRLTSESPVVRDNSVLKKRKLSSEVLYGGRTAATTSKQKMNLVEKVSGNRTTEKALSGLDVPRKVMVNKTLKKEVQTSLGKKNSLGSRLYTYVKESGSVKIGTQDEPDVVELSSKKTEKLDTSKMLSAEASLDPARKRRLCALMKDAASSITLEDVRRKHKVPSTHASSNRYAIERNITQGKVEGSVEAVRAALKKLQEGCSIEDAKAVCAPEILSQIYKWKSKLRVYLAPFLHGLRYSSFGRHFTKVEKLEEIADRLLGYVRNGDTIVDFCCGANDFSIIMKKKLEEMGKHCYFKNYDIIQAKNDFCFETRDWFTVQKRELPDGAKLIMGLNPPFGVKAALANKFIEKALEFQPKLLILIVPPETKSLPYDLIWKDDRSLSGKSFYLPGSVDENDHQIDQWNNVTPPLYLWSRPDWAERHRAIAQKDSHRSMSRGSMEDGHSVENKDENGNNNGKGHKERSFKGDDDRVYRTSSSHQKKQVKESERLQHGGRKKNDSRVAELLPDNKHDGGYVSGEIQKEKSPSMERQRKGNQHPEPSNSGSRTAYSWTAASIAHDTGSKNFTSSDEPYSSVIHRQSSVTSPSSTFRVTNLGEPVSRYMREMTETFLHRPYSLAMEDPFRRESDVSAQYRYYGQQKSDMYRSDYGQQNSDMYRSDYLVGQDSYPSRVGLFSPTYSHAHPGSAFNSSYRINTSATSAIERYAPRLLTQYTQPAVAYNDPHMYGGSMHDPRAPRPGDQGVPFSFAPGSHQGFSNQNSAGWLPPEGA